MAFYTPGMLPGDQVLSLSLDRYQELMRICPCAFNGVLRTDGVECCDCDVVWLQSDRDAIAIALAQAEEMRERELGYHLAPKYIEDEDYDYERPLILNRKHLISIGSQVCTDIQLNAVLVLSVLGVINDPVVALIATTVTDPDEIKVYYHGTDIEIHPTSVTIAGGIATISIPRCRLVDPDDTTNCDPPLAYGTDTNFVTAIDVKRCYDDPGDGAFLVWDSGCCQNCGVALAEVTQQLYPRIDDKRTAIIKWQIGTYSGGTWTKECCLALNCTPTGIRISYLSGRRSSVATEIETIRLAHTLLPNIIPDRLDLCAGCWKGDQVKDPSNLFTPYGDSRGAIAAWMSDSRAKIGWGGKTPRVR